MKPCREGLDYEHFLAMEVLPAAETGETFIRAGDLKLHSVTSCRRDTFRASSGPTGVGFCFVSPHQPPSADTCLKA